VKCCGGTTIAFDRIGEGSPVILVGGGTQYRAFDPSTAELAALLADRFTVLNYHRRGRGDSGDTEPYAVEAGVPAEYLAPMRDSPMWAGMEQAAHTLAYDGRVVNGFRLQADRVAAVDTFFAAA
jgi:hypothetical protein